MAARIITPPSFPLPETPHVAAAPSAGSRTRVWLVRHAEVHADWHGKAYGGLDVPLSSAGEADTRALGAAFRGRRVAQVTSSDLSRALAMGRAIAGATGAELVLEPRLREVDRGAWQGLAAAEFRARWERDAASFLADPWRWAGHAGESDHDLCARAWPALDEARSRAAGAEIVLTAHYNVIRVLVTRALGLATRASFEFRNDPAHATLLVDEPGAWRVLAQNVATPSAH